MGNDADSYDSIYEGCLETCAAMPALVVVVNGQSSCDATVNFMSAIHPEFGDACHRVGGWR